MHAADPHGSYQISHPTYGQRMETRKPPTTILPTQTHIGKSPHASNKTPRMIFYNMMPSPLMMSSYKGRGNV